LVGTKEKLKDGITIHVIDENKDMQKDFTIERNLLTRHMKYFQKCLKDIPQNEEIDISVHCDAQIFEWLIKYIELREDKLKRNNLDKDSLSEWMIKVNECSPENSNNLTAASSTKMDTTSELTQVSTPGVPHLDSSNVISIMISADFLRIEPLTKQCLEYVVVNIQEVAKLSIDMSCISSHIIKSIAQQLNIDEIDSLKERKDKLVSKLFMKKLELLLEKEDNHLFRCANCNRMLSLSQQDKLMCTSNQVKPYID
jgi:hypothetical protein